MRRPGVRRAWLCVGALLCACGGSTGKPVVAEGGAKVRNAEGGAKVRDAAERVVLCKTTEADLRASLGEPFRDGRLGEHRVVSWVAERDVERFLAVLVDARGVVVDLYWDVPGAVAWTPTDRCAATPPSDAK